MERPFVVLTTAVSNRPWSLIDQLVGGNSICGFGHIRFGIGFGLVNYTLTREFLDLTNEKIS
jgi:hypothetical protein